MKRILPLFLVLLLMLPAGCKQQNTETAAPGTVVENTETEQPSDENKEQSEDLGETEENIETEALEQDVPEVVQPEEAPAVEDVPEETPSEPTEEEKKAARLEEALIQAEKIYAQEKDTDYNDFAFYVYLNEYPEGGEFTTPMETIPDFPDIEIKEKKEYSHLSKNHNWERVYSHTVCIILPETNMELIKNTVRKIMKHDDVYDVKFKWEEYIFSY